MPIMHLPFVDLPRSVIEPKHVLVAIVIEIAGTGELPISAL